MLSAKIWVNKQYTDYIDETVPIGLASQCSSVVVELFMMRMMGEGEMGYDYYNYDNSWAMMPPDYAPDPYQARQPQPEEDYRYNTYNSYA